jgi:hypothetical protein
MTVETAVFDIYAWLTVLAFCLAWWIDKIGLAAIDDIGRMLKAIHTELERRH